MKFFKNLETSAYRNIVVPLQGKKTFDFDKLPLIRPTTKILIGAVFIIFGSVQLIPLLS